jgi:hypothetical protein
MSLTPFTSNYQDHSTEEGFQFTFFCDLCGSGYKTEFVESKNRKKKKFFKGLKSAASMASSFVKGADAVRKGSRALERRYRGMNPKWHKEHEKVFRQVQEEAKKHFDLCPKCHRYVCANCWNAEAGLCSDCAPREATEVAAARAEKMKEDIKDATSKVKVFQGDIDKTSATCPKCGKPSGGGKFCSNCGAPLGRIECPKCGADYPQGTKFCSECGTKLEQ